MGNDLGRSIRPGWRNIADPNRSFGVPSIRDDVPAPTLKSVADHQNYGDESNAGALLYPPRFSDQGITQVDFLLARSQEQMISLFKNAGFDLTEEQLANTFTKAASLDPQGRVSVESFRRTLNESMCTAVLLAIGIPVQLRTWPWLCELYFSRSAQYSGVAILDQFACMSVTVYVHS